MFSFQNLTVSDMKEDGVCVRGERGWSGIDVTVKWVFRENYAKKKT